MIDGYKIKDGKVIVVNYDKNNERIEEERDYQDNIEELLMAQNVREFLLGYKFDINKDIENINSAISYWKGERYARLIVTLVVSLCFGFFSLLFSLIVMLVIFLIGIIIGTKITFDCNKLIKNYKKELDGLHLLLEGIDEELEKNKIELRRLVNDDRVERDNINGKNYVQLNYVEELKKLKEYLELWGIVGANEEKLKKYDEKNIIYSKLQRDFKQDDIKTLRRILNRNNRKY